MKAMGVADEGDLPALIEMTPGGRPAADRRQAAEGRGPAGGQRAGLRLAAAGRAQVAAALDAGGRPDAGERGRGGPADRRAAGRCLVGRGKRAGGQGRGAGSRPSWRQAGAEPCHNHARQAAHDVAPPVPSTADLWLRQILQRCRPRATASWPAAGAATSSSRGPRHPSANCQPAVFRSGRERRGSTADLLQQGRSG